METQPAALPEVFPPLIPWKLSLYEQINSFVQSPQLYSIEFDPQKRKEKQFLHQCAKHFNLYYWVKKKKENSPRSVTISKRTRPLEPAIFNPQTQIWELSPFTFENQLKSEFIIVTQNVLFGPTEKGIKDPTCTRIRIPRLMEVLENTNADLIALQEVEPPFYKILLEQQWVRDKYIVSDLRGQSIYPYGNVLLSKFPFNRLYIHNYKEVNFSLKSMIVAEFTVNSRTFSVGVVHLKAGVDYDIRKGQVEEGLELLQNKENALLIGDFNFREGEGEPREDEQLKTEFLDIWETLHPDDRNSITYDIENNTIAAFVSKMATQRTGRESKSFRYDRMYIRSQKWIATEIHKIGIEPIPERMPWNGGPIFVSDHYGLETKLFVKEQ